MIFQSKKTKQREKLLKAVAEWESRHIVHNVKQIFVFRFEKTIQYISDNGKKFQLNNHCVHGEQKLGDLVKKAADLISVFREHLALRQSMTKQSKQQPIFDRIEEVFLALMEQYLNELRFFQYDRFDENDYRQQYFARVHQKLEQAEILLRHYGDYMHALTQTEYADTEGDRAGIEASVQALCDAVQEIQ